MAMTENPAWFSLIISELTSIITTLVSELYYVAKFGEIVSASIQYELSTSVKQALNTGAYY